MYQPKVTTTQKYSDSQGEHIVYRGKLVLVKENRLPKLNDLVDHGNNGYTIIKDQKHLDFALSIHKQAYYVPVKPIIISETEEIEVGDYVYVPKQENLAEEIFQVENEFHLIHVINSTNCSKILALPEQFSDKHLQAIADSKMEEGEVLVKCDEYSNNDPLGGYAVKYTKKVHLDQQNHITLFPVQQSLEISVPKEKFQEWVDRLDDFEWDVNRQCSVKEEMEKFISEWAAKNNYKGE